MISLYAVRTGGEMDAFCTKCDMNLGHTIIAMIGPKVVKVRCNTCQGHHSFRGDQPLAKAAGVAKPKAVVLGFEDRLKGRTIGGARQYSPKEYFRIDDVISHPTFGMGVVIANRADRIDVVFKAFEKTLVNGKAS